MVQQFESPASDVTVTIVPDPKEEVDYFLWRCISGEKFPPAMAAAMFSYGSWSARPAVHSFGTSGGPVAATWPILPRVGFGQTVVGTVTWEFNAAIDSTAFFNQGQIFLGQYVRFDYRTDANTWDFVTSSGSVVTTHAASALNDFAWHSVYVSITAAGVVTYKLNGTTLASYTLASPSTFNGDVVTPRWLSFGNSTAGVYISNMRVTWT